MFEKLVILQKLPRLLNESKWYYLKIGSLVLGLTCLRFTVAGFFFTAAGVAVLGATGMLAFVLAGPGVCLLFIPGNGADVAGVVGVIGKSSAMSIASLVELVMDIDLTGLVLFAFFVGLVSFGVGGISTSSLGIAAIFVRNNFSRVCAITTMSSPALLYT